MNDSNNGKRGNFYWAYDDENNILHLRDKDDFKGRSLINSITANFAKSIVLFVQREIGKKIDFDTMRCFIYTDGDEDGIFPNEVDEYIFAYEGTGKNPFRPLKKEDRALKYWFNKHNKTL